MVFPVFVCRMGSALLSRFDVVFLLLDIPDESHDRCLSEHVMANRAGKGRSSGAVVTRANGESETSILLQHSDMPLSERLQVKCLFGQMTKIFTFFLTRLNLYVSFFIRGKKTLRRKEAIQ